VLPKRPQLTRKELLLLLAKRCYPEGDMKTEKQDNQTDDNISWHPAFFEAIRLELAQYGDALQFIAE
jgi:hypothetical protein